MLKYFIYSLILVMSLSTGHAIEFKKGANVTQDFHPRLLRNVLMGGGDTIEGVKIVISKDAVVPDTFTKKWNERKLSGGTIPEVGSPSADVIFIEGF